MQDQWYNYKLTYTGRWNWTSNFGTYSHILRARNAKEAKAYLRKLIDERVIILDVRITWRKKA